MHQQWLSYDLNHKPDFSNRNNFILKFSVS